MDENKIVTYLQLFFLLSRATPAVAHCCICCCHLLFALGCNAKRGILLANSCGNELNEIL